MTWAVHIDKIVLKCEKVLNVMKSGWVLVGG